jgi:DNA polymerase III subunit beta
VDKYKGGPYMRILCSRENLAYGVQVVQRAVSSKSTLPILSGILIKTENNRLNLTATDLELGIHCSIPVQVIEEGSAVLPARLFSEIVRKLPDSPIELEMDPGSKT